MNASVDDVREFVAESPEAALALAESFFRTSAAELETWVVPPSVQISGLGSRVLMLAAPRSAAQSARPAPRREERRDDRGRGGERREERRDERRDERRPRERDRGERSAGPRERGEPGRDRGERSERDGGDRERPREEAPTAAVAAPVSTEPLAPGRLGPVGEFVTGILERMKVRDVVATEAETDDGEIVVTVGGRGIIALVEREPRLVAALSHLAHRAAEALVEGDEAVAQVVVHGARLAPREEGRERGGRDRGRDRGRDGRGGGDRGGERRPRRDPEDRDIDEGELERLAQDSARIARETGESQLLPPMNSRERWFVHNALKDERGVRSESEGDGARKRVRIFPA
jgi:hypothetical protein